MKVVIVGGGMVGAGAAVSLAKQGYEVTVIEAGKAVSSGGDWDLRISSIHLLNVEWLHELGTWLNIRAERKLMYTDLAVQTVDGQRLQFSNLDADAIALGAMVENNALQEALWAQFSEHNIRVYSETRVETFDLADRSVTLSNGEKLSYDLLLGADGAQSQVALAAHIGQRGWDYDMRCLLAIAEVEQPIPAATWEIFRSEGPFALLPLSTHQACLIDYRSESQWQEFSGNSDAVKQSLNEVFEPHIGQHTVTKFASFPLRRQRALRYISHDSVALIGDAAHSIHPLAGQGVNLGFADVQELTRQLVKQPISQALVNYERVRMQENQQMMRAMDAIHVGFRSQHLLPRGLVAFGFALVGKVAPLKHALVRKAIGF